MLQILPYNSDMLGRPAKGEPTEYGKHLAALRKAAGLSQAEVAQKLGIPQRTVSFYERMARYLPSNLVEPMAKLLGVTVNEIIGIKSEEALKRGPKTKLDRLVEEVRKLPRTKQEFIVKLLGQVLAAESA